MSSSRRQPAPPPDDDATPAEPGRHHRLRRLRPVIGAVVLVAVVVLLYRQGRAIDWTETGQQLREADPAWFALGLVAFHAGFLLRCARWRVLLTGANADDGITTPAHLPFPTLIGIMYRAWFVNTVTIARAGDAYRGYLLKQKTGASFSSSIGTIVSERIVDVMVLAVLLISAILLAFHQHLPSGVPIILALSALLAAAGPVALVSLRRLEPIVLRWLPARVRGKAAVLMGAMIGSVRQMPRLVLLSAGGWLGETLMLLFVARAIGVDLPITHAATVALLTALLTTLPITPGGLGVADAGIIFLLGTVDVASGPAAAIAILARLATFGSVVLIGGGWSLVASIREHPASGRLLAPTADRPNPTS